MDLIDLLRYPLTILFSVMAITSSFERVAKFAYSMKYRGAKP